MPPAPKINRAGRKFDQVLEGARQVFMADGFESANVDDIARVAGVSKATLYSYFPDKALLFSEVARCECDRMAEEAMSEADLAAAGIGPGTIRISVGLEGIADLLADLDRGLLAASRTLGK